MSWRKAKVTEPDNIILMNGKEAHILGVSKLIHGEYDEEEGSVKGKVYYNLSGQKHRHWFLLDLETGKRGLNPGSEEN